MAARRRSGPGRKRGVYAQAERILRLQAALLEGRIVRVPEFAEELGISPRQVQRDLAVVRGHLGEKLAQRDDGAWVVQRAAASAADRRSARSAILGMAIGAKLSLSLWGERAARLLRARVDASITGLGDTDASRFDRWAQRIAVVAPGLKDYAGRPELAQRLDQLLEALIRCSVVRLAYLSHPRAMKGLPARELIAHPLGLIHYRDGVYFIVDVTGGAGAEEKRGQRILLALDRIEHVSLVGESFTMPKGFDAQGFLGEAFGIWREGAVEEVEIEVEAAHARWVRERRIHASQQKRSRSAPTAACSCACAWTDSTRSPTGCCRSASTRRSSNRRPCAIWSPDVCAPPPPGTREGYDIFCRALLPSSFSSTQPQEERP